MNDPRLTNWLLMGILVVLIFQIWTGMERTVEAETFRLDDCITERIGETPRQYLHVVIHS